MSSVAFFDSRLADVDTLIAALPKGTAAFLLPENGDGLLEMAGFLDSHLDLAYAPT